METFSSFVVVQLLSHDWLFATPWTAARQASPSFTIFWSLLSSPPWSRWCHPTISSSVIPVSSHLQSFPASGSFLINWLYTSGDQIIGASASTSVLPMNIQDWSPLGWTGLISLLCKGFSRVFSTPHFENINSLVLSLLYGLTLTSAHDYWKIHSFD